MNKLDSLLVLFLCVRGKPQAVKYNYQVTNYYIFRIIKSDSVITIYIFFFHL